MADLSFTFNPSDMVSKTGKASSVAAAASDVASAASVAAADGSNALSKITNRSTTWDKASAASSAVIVAQSKASDASSAAIVAQSKASDASSATVALDATVIKSVPTTGSFAVHEIIYTSASSIKYVRSSVAAE